MHCQNQNRIPSSPKCELE
uniref:E. coli genes dicA, dicB, dicC and dicF n=1 Tax=Escherichia coli TaxID=562 RepID=Q47137_ECOLX|nr:unnamed protein product [Escherichia coli]